MAIQDYSEKDSFNLTNNITAYDRLLELIILYSKRNRNTQQGFNVYYGEKIIYDFEIIEKSLEKELLLGKKLLKNNQRLFIFSNEVFSKERNNLLSDFIIRYPQSKNENIINKFIKALESYEQNRDDIITVYQNLQYIIIYLMKYYTNKTGEKIKILLWKLSQLILMDTIYIKY